MKTEHEIMYQAEIEDELYDFALEEYLKRQRERDADNCGEVLND